MMIMITVANWREKKHTHAHTNTHTHTHTHTRGLKTTKKKLTAHGAHLVLDVEVGAGGDEGLHALHIVPASSRDKGRVAVLGRRSAGGRGRRGKKGGGLG